MDSKEIFSSNLRKLMARDRVTQVDLARRLKVTKTSVSYWYNGRSMPKLPVIKELADIFCCTTDDLLNPDYDLITGSPEERLLHIYRNLTDEGQHYLLQQAGIAANMFGKKQQDSLHVPVQINNRR